MKLKKALKNLDRAARTLTPDQGRIGRRNARRRVLGAMRTLRNVVESQYPAVKVARVPKDRLTDAADRMQWSQFEYRVIRHINLDWDTELADRFIEHVCAAKGVKRRELVVDEMRGRLLGRCMPGRILLRDSLSAKSKWRTLMHELGHAIDPLGWGHRRSFVRAMAEVYRMWIEFRRAGRAAAKRSEAE